MSLSLEYIGYDSDSGDSLGSFTRSYSIPISNLQSSDIIVICTTNQSSTGDWNRITGCTINSETATEAVLFGDATSYVNDGDRWASAIYYVTGITGSSLSISVSGQSSDVYRSSCVAYRITGGSVTVGDTDSDIAIDQDQSGSGVVHTTTVDIPANAITLTYVSSGANKSYYTVDFDYDSTATEDQYFKTEDYLDCSAAHVSTSSSARSNYDVEATLTSSSSNTTSLMITAVFAGGFDAPTGKIWGVENPASIWGIDVANIAKVHGL